MTSADQARDPAPFLTDTDTDTALDRLTEWGEQYALLMARRDPLVKAALTRPLSGHGDLRRVESATGLTPQTLRRLKAGDTPLLEHDSSAEVDWDTYADYLETMGTVIREKLDALPGERVFTMDDLRSQLLIRIADQIRTTEISDVGLWGLTMELRQEAARETRAGNPEAAGVRTEAADQITRFRTEGLAAWGHLDPAVLDRARTELGPPPASRLLAEPPPGAGTASRTGRSEEE
ncbi:hypothetical protein ABZW38_16620 [Streptomyces bacillaris]|uniref:hypothetical protein n=1 Tax=Streptomyces bacillaris TaxID=68179 RepID=UPI00345FAAA2